MKRIVVANLVVSSIALTASGVSIGVTCFGDEQAEPVEPVVYACTCPAEEATEPVTEPTTEPVTEPATEPVETVEPSETTESTDTTEQTEVADNIYLGEFRLTAYCPCSKCCGQWADGITSTGVTAEAGRTIAVDPSVIPYGTEVIVNGHKYIAEDCGSSIKGNRIDIYFNTHDEAWDFGVQYADVYIVGS